MRVIDCREPEAWDRYVANHAQGGVYHLYGWKRIFERAYRLHVHHLMVVDDRSDPGRSRVRGICSLFLLNSPGSRRRLIASPYVDLGGILADDAGSEALLIQEAVKIARTTRSRWIELRQSDALASLSAGDERWRVQVSSHKAGLQRPLPLTADELMQSFKSKLRSQIRKAMKNGLTHAVGGVELLPAFYAVFSHNMRDLGSPVHPYRLFEEVMCTFGSKARVVLVHRGRAVVAGALVLEFKNRLHNPWASSLRAHRRLGANMLLYWAMMAHACDTGANVFDFGRSSPGAGTFSFKRQWGAMPTPLFWYYLTLHGEPVDPLAEHLSYPFWKRLPLGLSRLLGPYLRRHIGL